MPYKSDAQRRYFNANKDELEAQGVDVDEWNESSKGKDLPEKASAYFLEGRQLIKSALDAPELSTGQKALLASLAGGLGGLAGGAVGTPAGAAAGALYGAGKREPIKGIGRGAVRGAATGAGLGLGSAAAGTLAGLSTQNPYLMLLSQLLGGAGGAGLGWWGSGKLLDRLNADYDVDRERQSKEGSVKLTTAQAVEKMSHYLNYLAKKIQGGSEALHVKQARVNRLTKLSGHLHEKKHLLHAIKAAWPEKTETERMKLANMLCRGLSAAIKQAHARKQAMGDMAAGEMGIPEGPGDAAIDETGAAGGVPLAPSYSSTSMV